MADSEVPDSDRYPVMRRRKAFACPHCGEMCSLPVSIQVLEPEKFIESEDSECETFDPYRGLTADQRDIVVSAERGGILEAFGQACANRNGAVEQTPRRLGKFFVTFLRTARPKIVPGFVLRHYIQQFNGQIEFWGSQGVLGVVADGKLRAFLPLAMAAGMKVKKVAGGGMDARRMNARLSAEDAEFQDWVKTRHGYVPSECRVFMAEIRKRSIGDFANVSLTSA